MDSNTNSRNKYENNYEMRMPSKTLGVRLLVPFSYIHVDMILIIYIIINIH